MFSSNLTSKRSSGLSSAHSDTQVPPPGFWTRLAGNKNIWNDADEEDELIDSHVTCKQCWDYQISELNIKWKIKWNTLRSHPYIAITTTIVLALLIAISTALNVVSANRYEVEKKDMANAFAKKAGNWFKQELDKAISPLFILEQFVKEMPIFHDLPFLMGQGGEPGSAPYINDTVVTHRNVSGVCDNSTVIDEFDRIAKNIKESANMTGVLISLNLSPHDVACTFYPLNNTEDFVAPMYLDNSGAVGHDLLKDPKRVKVVLETHASNSFTVAGPLTLTQCPDCPPTVKNAFIARMPVNMPPELGYNINAGGVNYSSWGFVAAVINWDSLLKRSDYIHDRFENKGMQYELTKTDSILNTTTTQFFGKTTVLDLTIFSRKIDSRNYYNVSLQVTNSNWTMAVAYDDGFGAPWLGWAIAISVMVSIAFSVVLLVILLEKQEHKNLLHEMLPKKALKKLARGGMVIDEYKMVTIFFSDIVGYTSMTADMQPITVMKFLNSFYIEVDKIADRYKVYKVKTIGDAYMCMGGCPDKCSVAEGAERVALFALDLMELVKSFRTEDGVQIVIRAGIHSGPIAAGVIERKRPQYAIFGDSVNVASSMEQYSKPMKIQCSDRTAHLLRQAPSYYFSVKERGKVSIKDLGRIHTWYIEGAKEYIGRVIPISKGRKVKKGDEVMETRFEKIFSLGRDIDSSKITANLADGIMAVTSTNDVSKNETVKIPVSRNPVGKSNSPPA
jgi:class 3 adenylate cyclase/sensor domain CHASE-containing protein